METIDDSSSGSQFFKLFGTSTDEMTKSLAGIVSLSQRNSPAHNWDVNDLLGPWPTGNNINNNINSSNSNNNNINNINDSRGFHGNSYPFRTDGGSLQAPGSKSNTSIDSYNIGSSSLLSRKDLSESKFNCDGLWSTNDLLSPISDSSYNSLLSTSTSLSKGLEPCINTTSNTTSSSTASCFDNVTLNHHIQRNDLASSISLNLNGNNKSSYLFPPLVKGNGNCLYDIEPGTTICHSNAVNVSTSRRGTLSSHYASSSSSSSIVDSPRIQEDEFESQIAKIANEIHSTIQLHIGGLQIRREQLLQQLENVKRIYLQLFKQQQSSPSSPSTGSSCSSGSHIIEVNGFGGGFGASNNNNGNNGNRRIGFNQSRGCYDSNSEIGHSLPIPSVTFTKPDSALLKAVSSLGFLTTPAFAPCCSATGDGLEVAVPGLNNNFTIVTRNCFNEELLIGRENIFVKIVPAFNSSSSSSTQNSSSASSPSSSISSSPLICASIYGASNGNGSGGGNSHGVKDGLVKDLLGLDIGSNSSNSTFGSNQQNHHLGSQSSSLNIPYTLLDHNNGKYTVTYLVPNSRTLPNELSITILVNRIPLNDSPFHVPVQLEQRSRWRLGLTFGSEGNAIGQLCRPWGVAIVRMPPFMLTPQYMASSSANGDNSGNNGSGGNSCSENSNNNASNSTSNTNIYNSTSTGNSCSSSSLTGNQVNTQTCSNLTSTTGMTVGSGVGNGNHHQQQQQSQQKQVNQQFGCDKIPQSSSSGHKYFSSSSSPSHLNRHLQQTNQNATQNLQTNLLSGQMTTGNSYTSFFSSDNTNGISISGNTSSVVGNSLSTNNSNATATNSITGIESSSFASSTSLSSSTGPGPNINTNNNNQNGSKKYNNKYYLIAVGNNRIQLLHFDAGAMSIKLLQVFGSGPRTRGCLSNRPACITINTSLNHIIVADKDNHRIQVFDINLNLAIKEILPINSSIHWM